MALHTFTWPAPVPGSVTSRRYLLYDITAGVTVADVTFGIVELTTVFNVIIGHQYSVTLWYYIGTVFGEPQTTIFTAADETPPVEPSNMVFTRLGYTPDGKVLINVGFVFPTDPDVVTRHFRLYVAASNITYDEAVLPPLTLSRNMPALVPELQYLYTLYDKDLAGNSSPVHTQMYTGDGLAYPPAPAALTPAVVSSDIDAAGNQHAICSITVPIVPVNGSPRNVDHQIVKVYDSTLTRVLQQFSPTVSTVATVTLNDIHLNFATPIAFVHTYHSSSGESVGNSSPPTVTTFTPADTFSPTNPNDLSFQRVSTEPSGLIVVSVSTNAVYADDFVTRRQLYYWDTDFPATILGSQDIPVTSNAALVYLEHPNTYGFMWRDYDAAGNFGFKAGQYTTTIEERPPQPGESTITPISP